MKTRLPNRKRASNAWVLLVCLVWAACGPLPVSEQPEELPRLLDLGGLDKADWPGPTHQALIEFGATRFDLCAFRIPAEPLDSPVRICVLPEGVDPEQVGLTLDSLKQGLGSQDDVQSFGRFGQKRQAVAATATASSLVWVGLATGVTISAVYSMYMRDEDLSSPALWNAVVEGVDTANENVRGLLEWLGVSAASAELNREHELDQDHSDANAQAQDETEEDAYYFYSSMSTVEALNGNVGSLVPPLVSNYAFELVSKAIGSGFGYLVDAFLLGINPRDLLKPMSCLGYYGALGPYGPLGLSGPLGKDIFHPEHWISRLFDWTRLQESLTELGGPLSADGPLGHLGPLNPARWEDLEKTLGILVSNNYPMFKILPDFATQLKPGGLWAVLGPTGPLGPLGPLGALGPVGAHGHKSGQNGQYLDGDHATRFIQVDYLPKGHADYTKRLLALVEHYTEEGIREMRKANPGFVQDASFAITGHILEHEHDSYRFRSMHRQPVTIALVPLQAKHGYLSAMSILFSSILSRFSPPVYLPSPPFFPYKLYDHRGSFDDFDLEVEIFKDGRKIDVARSTSRDFVDWVHMNIPAGTRLRIHVTLVHDCHGTMGQTFSGSDDGYRLVVVGATNLLRPEIRGAHQRPLLFTN